MKQEEPIIMNLDDGFGPYTHDPQRAIYLSSAALTMFEPDEVFVDTTLLTAHWVYIKEFRSTPYTHTILYVAHRRQEGHIVPTTSFAATPGDARRKRKGTLIYP